MLRFVSRFELFSMTWSHRCGLNARIHRGKKVTGKRRTEQRGDAENKIIERLMHKNHDSSRVHQ